MKKITLALAMLISVAAFAQTNSDLKAHYEAYYKKMKAQADVQGVINALTHLDILEPSQARKDTIAYLYMSNNNYIQALNTIGIDKNATDSDLNVEVKAISLQNINEVAKALEQYEVLYSRKPNPSLAYQIADLSLQNKDIPNAMAKIEYGLKNVTDDMKRAFYETQRPYETSLKAALLYMKALATFQQNQSNLDGALKLVNDALVIDPNFNLAKNAREALEKKKAEPKN